MEDQSPQYLLGTSDAELDRLGYQHQVWAQEATWIWREAGFGWGQELMDLGCGPGDATIDLAHWVGPDGHLHAVDQSAKFLNVLRKRVEGLQLTNVSTHETDVHDLSAFQDESVEGVFTRWLLCFVRDPEKVVAEAYRVLRPGGRLAVIDYFNYLAVGVFPERKAFKELFKAYYDSVRSHGGSYDIGNELPRILGQAGFEVGALKPISRIGRVDSPEWHWFRIFTEGYLPKLMEEGLLNKAQHERLMRDWNDVKSDPATFFCPPPMMAVVGRKPH